MGQENTTTSLARAIMKGRVRQAYIFAGMRGTGKTTTARVFAKSLNCLEAQEPTIAPCLKCRSCEAVQTGDDISVIEIDGASNNKVDDARKLIEEVGFYGMHGRFKIYIIDEVHMLTKPAFNALLKTLEEPPSHVKFILCTTELDKIPKTVQSRCQLFRFHPVPADIIADQLEKVAEQEGLETDDNVTIELAKMVNGSMRDGLTLLDQLINSAKDDKLTLGDLEGFFGKPSPKYIQNIMGALSSGNVAKTASAVKWLLERGFGEYYVITTLIDSLRSRMADRLGEPDKLKVIVDIILALEKLSRIIRTSEIPGALFEATLLKIALDRRNK